ncbi:MAG: hypothetical protein JNJ62_02275 [Pseudoxanthomonas mexicana]|nr:hypothetical protein [Pseudoxanthomonas mexicana]
MTSHARQVNSRGPAGQQGIALVVVLVLLVAVSILGVAVMRSSAMQERMSANLRDRSIAFESAESVLLYVQTTVMASRAWAQTRPSNGDCTTHAVCPNGAAPAWRGAPASAYDSGLLLEPPEYWVEYLGQGVANKVDDDSQCKSEEERNNPSLDCRTLSYRVTVRSRAAGRADVLIQANIVGSTQAAGF